MDRTACTEPQCLYKGALYLTLSYVVKPNKWSRFIASSFLTPMLDGGEQVTSSPNRFSSTERSPKDPSACVDLETYPGVLGKGREFCPCQELNKIHKKLRKSRHVTSRSAVTLFTLQFKHLNMFLGSGRVLSLFAVPHVFL
jgi:hypothetical protein